MVYVCSLVEQVMQPFYSAAVLMRFQALRFCTIGDGFFH